MSLDRHSALGMATTARIVGVGFAGAGLLGAIVAAKPLARADSTNAIGMRTLCYRRDCA